MIKYMINIDFGTENCYLLRQNIIFPVFFYAEGVYYENISFCCWL